MNVKDSHGIPMGNHLETLYDPRTDTYYLRFIPTLLTPTMCFYSFDATKVAAMNDGKMPIFPHVVSFLPDRYLDEMCYEKDTASFLFINSPEKFFEELKEQVPIAIKQNENILTTDRYYHTKGKDDCELLQIKLIILDICLQTSIMMSQDHRQNSFGNTHNIIFNQRFESPF